MDQPLTRGDVEETKRLHSTVDAYRRHAMEVDKACLVVLEISREGHLIDQYGFTSDEEAQEQARALLAKRRGGN